VVDSSALRSGSKQGVTTVLIVDQHVLFSEGLERLLSHEPDFRVVGRTDRLQEAVNKAVSLAPDLVLMELELRDGSGLEAMQQILARRPESAIVILTTHDSDAHLFEAFRFGARGYWVKDSAFATLLTALRALRNGELVLSRTMTSRVVQEFYRSRLHITENQAALDGLTTREQQVLGQLATGASNREIAERLVISEYTVKAHVRNILEKLGLKNRSQAAGLARRLGFVDLSRKRPA
jgi:DNA-binding NarL/FixJ family response regulator